MAEQNQDDTLSLIAILGISGLLVYQLLKPKPVLAVPPKIPPKVVPEVIPPIQRRTKLKKEIEKKPSLLYKLTDIFDWLKPKERLKPVYPELRLPTLWDYLFGKGKKRDPITPSYDLMQQVKRMEEWRERYQFDIPKKTEEKIKELKKKRATRWQRKIALKIRKTLLPYEAYITKWAKRFNFDPDLIRAIIWQESSGNPKAIGDQHTKNPSYGLMQITLPTAREITYPGDRGPELLLNPNVNIYYGTKYLHKLLHVYGPKYKIYDLKDAVIAYNVGPGNVKRRRVNTNTWHYWWGWPDKPVETRRGVKTFYEALVAQREE